MNFYKLIQINIKSLIFLGALTFILFYLISFLLPITYKSTAKLFPTDRSNQSMLNESSPLNSFLGVGAMDPNVKRHVSILNSEDFIFNFLLENQYLHLILDRNIDYANEEVNNDYKLKYSAVRIFKSKFYSAYDITTGEMKFDFIWDDRFVAAKILTNLIDHLNIQIAQKEIQRSQMNIEYLLTFLRNNPNQEASYGLIVATNNLLESESKKIMFATTVPDYAFQIIDSPSITPERHSPNRFFIGLCAAIIFAISRIIYLSYENNLFRNQNISE